MPFNNSLNNTNGSTLLSHNGLSSFGDPIGHTLGNTSPWNAFPAFNQNEQDKLTHNPLNPNNGGSLGQSDMNNLYINNMNVSDGNPNGQRVTINENQHSNPSSVFPPLEAHSGTVDSTIPNYNNNFSVNVNTDTRPKPSIENSFNNLFGNFMPLGTTGKTNSDSNLVGDTNHGTTLLGNLPNTLGPLDTSIWSPGKVMSSTPKHTSTTDTSAGNNILQHISPLLSGEHNISNVENMPGPLSNGLRDNNHMSNVNSNSLFESTSNLFSSVPLDLGSVGMHNHTQQLNHQGSGSNLPGGNGDSESTSALFGNTSLLGPSLSMLDTNNQSQQHQTSSSSILSNSLLG